MLSRGDYHIGKSLGFMSSHQAEQAMTANNNRMAIEPDRSVSKFLGLGILISFDRQL